MKTKKPDRFERMVLKRSKAGMLDSIVALINKDIREYRKVVADTGITKIEHMQAVGAWTAMRDLLAILKKRAT